MPVCSHLAFVSNEAREHLYQFSLVLRLGPFSVVLKLRGLICSKQNQASSTKSREFRSLIYPSLLLLRVATWCHCWRSVMLEIGYVEDWFSNAPLGNLSPNRRCSGSLRENHSTSLGSACFVLGFVRLQLFSTPAITHWSQKQGIVLGCLSLSELPASLKTPPKISVLCETINFVFELNAIIIPGLEHS